MRKALKKPSIQYLKHKTTEPENNYKEYKNLFNKLIKKAKKKFLHEKVVEMSRKYQNIMAINERNNR